MSQVSVSHERNVWKSQNTLMPVFFCFWATSMIISIHVIHLAPIRTIADHCQNSSVCPPQKYSVYDYFATYRHIFYFVTYIHILYSILWLTDTFSILWLHYVKQLASVRSQFCHRKAILALLDQLTIFGQRESLTIHASSGFGRMSAVSSAQSVNMLQSVAARWRCTKWLGNWKFTGSHPSNYLRSQTLLNINDYMTSTLSKAMEF